VNLPILPASPSPAKVPRPAPVHGPWRLARLLDAPHRLGFFAGATLLAITAAWWTTTLVARAAGVSLPWAVPPGPAHGLAFAFGFMPLFIVGFFFTAGPRWLGLPAVEARTLVAPVCGLFGGWLVALAGFHVSATIAAAGIGLATLCWVAVLARLLKLITASHAPDRTHAWVVALAGCVGALAMGAAAAGIATGHPNTVRAATAAALWGFLAPTFASVSHRMIPFFTASAMPRFEAWAPNGLMALMLAALGISAVVSVAEAIAWPLAASWHIVAVVVQAPAAALMVFLAFRWGLVQSLRIRLLAMLHAGFVWLGIALALSALSHARILVWGEAAGLGLAPLHALTAGYLGATLFAMTTRVSSGHSGRPLSADNPAWLLYLAVQAAALSRVTASLWPAIATPLTVAAAVAWAFACVGWALRYGNWFGRPRVDGRPG
jgi:uncharacterized protein involved in response to NO